MLPETGWRWGSLCAAYSKRIFTSACVGVWNLLVAASQVLAVSTGARTAHGLLKSLRYLTSVSMLPSSTEPLQVYPGYPSAFAADPIPERIFGSLATTVLTHAMAKRHR